MSRVIVKNIPAYLSDARMKEHFSSQGSVVTDAKVIRRHDGTSRQFGFVGFKTEAEAQEALRYFNRTFIDTLRIDVGIAKAVGDEAGAIERRSERVKAVEEPKKKTEEVKKKNRNAKGVNFDEFMAIMAPKKKRKTWQNEEGEDGEAKLVSADFQPEIVKEKSSKKKQRREDTGVAEIQEVASKKSDADAEQQDEVNDEVVMDEGLTDLDYMYKRMKRKVGEDLEERDKHFDQSESEGEKEEEDTDAASEDESIDEREVERQKQERATLEEKAKKDQENVDAIMTSGRLFIRNLPFDATEEELERYFSQYGEVTQAHVTLDKATKRSKGIAFVTFADPSHALAAYRSSDGTTFQGRLLHIMPAIQLRANDKEAASVKDKKRMELKAGATKDFNWSTLFMSADAVASSIASRLGVSKSDILNPEEEVGSKKISPAVRLALAETSVIQETKDYLEKEGINVDAFQGSSVKRSDTVTLVKNIPFGTKEETLQGLFEKYGKVERVVMPPSGTVAIVEMEVSGESKVAFKALAYKRLGNSVLYLEKAPLGILSDMLPRKEQAAAAAEPLTSDQPTSDQGREDITQSGGTATLFVKNLAFSTTDERLNLAFANLPDFAFAQIQRRPSKNGQVKLSMGYGFVGFKSADGAKRAQKAMDKTTLDGHLLSVSLAKRGHDADDAAIAASNDGITPEGNSSTKLIIKNLPFQATKKEVRDLFAAHGKLKSVRVPRKSAAGVNLGGGGASGVRGFGFVEFVNRKEAENAYKNLKHTHLLGRHLILEWDLQDVGSREHQIDILRKKTARGLQDVGIKKTKLRLNDEDIRAAAIKEKEQAEDDDDDDEEEEGE